MIKKSIFRNKNTKIYIILFSLIFTFLFIISILYLNIKNKSTEYYIKASLAYCYENDYQLNKINKSKLITNIKKGKFSNITFKEDLDNIFNGPFTSGKTLIVLNNKLKDNETIIHYYKNYFKNNNNNYLKELNNINFNEIKLKVKGVEEDKNIFYLEVSNYIFNKFDNKNNIYLFNLKKDDEYVKKKHNLIHILTNQTSNDINIINKFNKYTTVLLISIYLIIFIGIIVYIININNLLYDLNHFIYLYRIIGYSKKNIKNIIYKNVTIINCFCILISLIVSLILLNIINIYYKIDLSLFNYPYIILLMIIIFIKNSCIILNKIK